MMQSDARHWTNVPLRKDGRFESYFHTLSHDLRTPLTQITGFAELLNLDENLALAQRDYAAAIVSACGELNHAVLAHLGLIESSLCGTDRSDPPVDDAAHGTGRGRRAGTAAGATRARSRSSTRSTPRSRDDSARG